MLTVYGIPASFEKWPVKVTRQGVDVSYLMRDYRILYVKEWRKTELSFTDFQIYEETRDFHPGAFHPLGFAVIMDEVGSPSTLVKMTRANIRRDARRHDFINYWHR